MLFLKQFVKTVSVSKMSEINYFIGGNHFIFFQCFHSEEKSFRESK